MTQFTSIHSHARLRRAFSLIEVMLAVFIFSIGLIMVITIFPVGADWTRQATESTIAQEVAQNALGVIQSHYPVTNALPALPTVPPLPNTADSELVPFPGCYPNGGTITLPEMCYQFGAASPCPADSNKATYFWTAFIRPTPTTTVITLSSNSTNGVTEPAGLTVKYDVYILVFKKGTPAQMWTGTIFPPSTPSPTPVPQIQYNGGNYARYSVGNYNTSTNTWTDSTGAPTPPNPAVGEYGIGLWSGTVFRQQMRPPMNSGLPPTQAQPLPGVLGWNKGGAIEPVIIGQPADGATTSPLIYVFQTTVAWKHP